MPNSYFNLRHSDRTPPPGPTKDSPAAHTAPPVQLSARAARRAADRATRRTPAPTPEGN